MNARLTDQRKDCCLRVLYEGIVAIRMAGGGCDAERCTQIADALHNVPDLVRVGDTRGWSVDWRGRASRRVEGHPASRRGQRELVSPVSRRPVQSSPSDDMANSIAHRR